MGGIWDPMSKEDSRCHPQFKLATEERAHLEVLDFLLKRGALRDKPMQGGLRVCCTVGVQILTEVGLFPLGMMHSFKTIPKKDQKTRKCACVSLGHWYALRVKRAKKHVSGQQTVDIVHDWSQKSKGRVSPLLPSCDQRVPGVVSLQPSTGAGNK